jgi:invasion protein IalB
MTFDCGSASLFAPWARRAAFAACFALSVASAQAQDQSGGTSGDAAAAAQGAVEQPEWEKICGTVNDQQECHIGRKRLAATGQPIAQFLVIEREGKKLLQVAVPPVALIQPGVQIKIDDGEPTGVQYVVCTPGECLALGEINEDFIGRLKRGGNVVISMVNPQGKPVSFDISLVGFTSTYDGPGIDPEEAQQRQQRLEDELKRKADEARERLMQLQQQQSSTTQ